MSADNDNSNPRKPPFANIEEAYTGGISDERVRCEMVIENAIVKIGEKIVSLRDKKDKLKKLEKYEKAYETLEAVKRQVVDGPGKALIARHREEQKKSP